MKGKILVVDDERSMSHLIRQIFRQEIREDAYELLFAENGIQALSQVEQAPDLRVILTDINMPEMDGLALLRELDRHYPAIVVVMISAYADLAHVRQSMNLGAFDYLVKPIDPKDLKETVSRAFARAAGKRERSR